MYDTVLYVIKRDIDMVTTITLENLKEDPRQVYAQRFSEYRERAERGHGDSVLYANANRNPHFNKGKNFKSKKIF